MSELGGDMQQTGEIPGSRNSFCLTSRARGGGWEEKDHAISPYTAVVENEWIGDHYLAIMASTANQCWLIICIHTGKPDFEIVSDYFSQLTCPSQHVQFKELKQL